MGILFSTWGIASIVIAAILFAFYAWFCARKISAVNTAIDSTLKNLESAQEFHDIDEADAAFAGNERLASVWKNFRGTLTQTRDGIFSSTDAAEFFSPQNFTRDMNMTFWQSYGGIFTGLGILGTFGGLIYGLSGVDMTSGDIEVLKTGIANLLSGVEKAFVTSLVGIFCAIVYSVFHHKLLKDFHANVQTLANAIDKKFPCKTAETWLAQSYPELQSQTVSLQNLGETVQQAIHDGLDEKLKEICEAVGKIGTGGSKGVKDAVTDSAGDELDNFANALNTFSTNSSELTEALKTTNTTFKSIKNLLSSTESFLKRVEAAGNSLTKAADPVKQSSELLKTHLAETTELMKNLAAENKTSSENISALTGQLATFVKNFNGIADELERSTKIIRESLDGYNTTMSKELANALKNFDDSMSRALGGLNEAIESFSEGSATSNNSNRNGGD